MSRHIPPAFRTMSIIYAVCTVMAIPSPSPGDTDAKIHPVFPLLDRDGNPVQVSGNPVSTMKSCAACHNTEFIADHSHHADAGLHEWVGAGQVRDGLPWDSGRGLYGQWSPGLYRYLTQPGDARIDMGTADFLRYYGQWHVGGGPAMTSRDGTPLTDLNLDGLDPETHVMHPRTGDWIPWNWEQSGTVEMNCFLCHAARPDNPARIRELESGRFEWANTATLQAMGIVSRTNDQWQWQAGAFDVEGNLRRELSQMEAPNDQHCGQCHGYVHTRLDQPVVFTGRERYGEDFITTGQIRSPQRISDSGLNLENKARLSRPFDVHSERLVACINCHYSMNNPVYHRESEDSMPEHLSFDPRRMDLREYLYRPSHRFAHGPNQREEISGRPSDIMRRCDGCHDASVAHDWLPFRRRHMDAISCETCHIPKLYGPTRESMDWTFLRLDGSPREEFRGTEDPDMVQSISSGYEPVLLLREDVDGKKKLSPYNLVTTWLWTYGDPPRPVRLIDLKAALYEEDAYHPDLLPVFDADRSGAIEEAEAVLDTEAKIEAVRLRLEGTGLTNVTITSDVRAHAIHHNVASHGWAIRDCAVCHGGSSRIYKAMTLSVRHPAGAVPQVLPAGDIHPDGKVVAAAYGAYVFHPDHASQNLYILGHDSAVWAARSGQFIFLMILLGITAHGGGRWLASRKRRREQGLDEVTVRVMLYSGYERFWHWLQASAILILMVTGIVIHLPDRFAFLSFHAMVTIHNVVGFILLLNALFSLFYHLASEEIRQYLPEPQGFFQQIGIQLSYYIKGMFHDEPHPFEKSPDRKLNPLQRITYLMILNILLPLQIVTGGLIWGAQHWPELTQVLGGLGWLIPIHSFGAWLFAGFLVMHIYLTTTGYRVLTNLKAMLTGWEDTPISHVPGQGKGKNR